MPQSDIYAVARHIPKDEDATTSMVKEYSGYIFEFLRPFTNQEYCRRVFGAGVEWQDLWQECMIGLLIADVKFNEDYNDGQPWPEGASTAPFKPYLHKCLENRLKKLHRENMEKDLDMRSIEGTVRQSDAIEIENVIDPTFQIEDTLTNVSEQVDSTLAVVEFAQKMLKPFDRKVVEYLRSVDYDATNAKIAEKLGVPESKVWYSRHRMRKLACLFAAKEMPDWEYDLKQWVPGMLERARKQVESEVKQV